MSTEQQKKLLKRRHFITSSVAVAGTFALLKNFSNFIQTEPQTEWNPSEIKLGGAHGNQFDLRSTLPNGVSSGGRFDIDPQGAKLPEGIFLSDEGLLYSNHLNAETLQIEGVVFTYSEPA